MRKAFLCTLLPLSLIAQEQISVEKLASNVQIGFIGAYLNTEFKVDRKATVKAELGMIPRFYSSGGSIWHTNIAAEPRWYYNLDKRQEKGKDISNNAGNFLALTINYRPAMMLFSTNQYLTKDALEQSVSFIPKWAMRRNINNNFSYEVGAGLGIRHEFEQKSIFSEGKRNYAELDLHLRIGYTF